MNKPRTLVVTIDAHNVSDVDWRTLKYLVNQNIDKIIPHYCRDGAQVWRRSDDVSILLEDES